MINNNVLEYKGYHTRVEFDANDRILTGKIEGITDFVNFECEDLKDVEKEFHEAVDGYIEFCKEAGKEPEKEYKGTFNVRIKPELHKQLAVRAFKENETLNSAVEKAIEEYVNGKEKRKDIDKKGIRVEASLISNEAKYKSNQSVRSQSTVVNINDYRTAGARYSVEEM